MSTTVATTSSDIHVERWPSEIPLFLLALMISIGLWMLAVISLIGIFYAVLLGVFFFIVHLGVVAHVRGNGVRLAPNQFPELHAAVEGLAHRIGMRKVPEAYLIQGGGMLNAFATRFIGSDIVVLYTDLIEACGPDHAARDMIIAHELGHLHCGHLRWIYLIAPAMLVPFLSGALSRAREYTCDRYGRAGAGNAEGAVLGLTILAAGGAFARQIDRRALMTQRSAFNSGWMTIGEWLSTHPPLVKRIAQIDPSLRDSSLESNAGVIRAFAILAAALAPIFMGGLVAALLIPAWLARHVPGGANARQTAPTFQRPAPAIGTAQARRDFEMLASFIRDEQTNGHGMPWDTRELYDRWNALHPTQHEPYDPFDGARYSYAARGSEFRLFSVGPDGEWDTDDDLIYDSRAKTSAHRTGS